MLSIISPYSKVIEAVVLAVALYFGYNWVGDQAVNKYKLEQSVLQVKVDKEQQEKYNKVSTELEALKLTRQENAKTITRTVEKIIDRPVYRDSPCMDYDGLSVINSALSGSASKFDDKMPPTK